VTASQAALKRDFDVVAKLAEGQGCAAGDVQWAADGKTLDEVSSALRAELL